jgi:hypothetical protein
MTDAQLLALLWIPSHRCAEEIETMVSTITTAFETMQSRNGVGEFAIGANQRDLYAQNGRMGHG